MDFVELNKSRENQPQFFSYCNLKVGDYGTVREAINDHQTKSVEMTKPIAIT